jgi:DNA-binding MarR family transcriptional regulator
MTTRSPDDDIDATLSASRALLGVVARSVSHALQHVSLPQFRILVILASRGPLRIGALAEEMGANPSTFSRTIDRMEHAGWVLRVTSSGSRREVLVDITDPGRTLVDDVTARRRQEIARILEALPADERAAIAAALASFADAAGEPNARTLLTLGL